MGELEPPPTEVFASLIALAVERDGVRDIKDLPGCWERELGGGWRASLNGHPFEVENSHGQKVPPYHALIEHPEYIGWLAIVGYGGGSCGAGCEERILDAIKTAPPLVKP